MRRLGLVLAVGLLLVTPSWAKVCGTERWAVKTGTDHQATFVNLDEPTDTTIAGLRQLVPPHPLPADRLWPVETKVWRIRATLVAFKLEADRDYHLVVADEDGQTLIAEIPSPTCVGAASPFRAAIEAARDTVDQHVTVRRKVQRVQVPVVVSGVGFFDGLHGQLGVAPNGIELHPVTGIEFTSGTR